MLPTFLTNPNPNIYLTGTYATIDIETTNINKGSAVIKNNRILYTSIKFSDGTRLSLEGDEVFLSRHLDKLCSVDFIIAHNAKFELQWLLRAGIELNKAIVFDTMIAEYVLAGNRKWPLDLDSVTRKYGGSGKAGFISAMIAAGICPSELPKNRLHSYCNIDVDETEKTFLAQRALLSIEGLLPIFYTRCLVTPMLADIGMIGMHLDKDRVYEIYTKYVAEHRDLVSKLDKITGGINMASPQQVAEFLYGELGFKELTDRRGNKIRGKPSKKFPEGNPKTDEETITQLKCTNKRQREFIELKLKESELRKKITTYLELFIEACEEHDCLLHGSINQTITMTQRLSSSKPNMQNFDRKLKKVFNSRNPEWKVRSNDYRQLEFRVAALLAQDKQAYEDIVHELDIHSYTASIIFNKPYEYIVANKESIPEVKGWRQDSKEHTFKPLYGGESGTPEEQRYYKAFKEKYKSITELQDGWVAQCQDKGWFRIPTGLIYYFPDTRLTNSGYITNSTNIKNYPVQCIATGDIAPMGAVFLWHRMKDLGLKSFIINIVHDSVENEEAPDEHEVMGNLVHQALSKDIVPYFKQMFGMDINYPLDIDTSLHTHWGED